MKSCDICGIDDAVLIFGGERVCRDCFAGCVAVMLLAPQDDDDYDASYSAAMQRGYEDADTVLNGGRLPY